MLICHIPSQNNQNKKCINKKEEIDIEKIEQMVQQMLDDYYDKINQEAERIEKAQNRLANLMLPEESATMKKLYYEAAKLLHPDVNPNLSEEQKQLWIVISGAYKNGDLQTVRNVTAAIGSLSETPEEINEYDSLTCATSAPLATTFRSHPLV